MKHVPCCAVAIQMQLTVIIFKLAVTISLHVERTSTCCALPSALYTLHPELPMSLHEHSLQNAQDQGAMCSTQLPARTRS